MEALRALGARSVPVVAKGNRYVFAQSLKTVSDFLGLQGDFGPALSPEELVSRLDNILAAALRLARQFPDHELQTKLKNRDRTYRQLTHHIFRIPEAFVEAVGRNRQLTYEALTESPPDELRTGDDIAAYGERVRRKVAMWWREAGPSAGSATADTYYGELPLHEVLERTTWHAGQHVRQVTSILEGLGIRPDRPPTAADFAGLPMPKSVWDD